MPVSDEDREIKEGEGTIAKAGASPSFSAERNKEILESLKARVALVREIAEKVLQEGQKGEGDFSSLPGLGKKKHLLKPGAEKIGLAFGYRPKYEIERREFPPQHTGLSHTDKTIIEPYHREYEITCNLYDDKGVFQGSGVGICSTMESFYRYREQKKKCPDCKAEAIIKGREEYGGGWLCYDKKGGCGSKWSEFDPVITKQITSGMIENENIADTYNNVKKAAAKRAYLGAIITATASGDLFTPGVTRPEAENEEEAGEDPAPGTSEQGEDQSSKGTLAMKRSLIKQIWKQKFPLTTFPQLQEWMTVKYGGDLNRINSTDASRVIKELQSGGKDFLDFVGSKGGS